MRDHTQLVVFSLADDLVTSVYRGTSAFPKSETYGLRSQVRRAAVSVVANIVEGSARSSQTEYLRFLEIAYGSAKELQYELDLCARLGFLDQQLAKHLDSQCTATAKSLNALIHAFK